MLTRSLRLLLFLTFASALLLAMIQTASACSCAARPTVLDEFDGSDEVVILRITSVEKVEDNEKNQMYHYVDGVRTTTAVIEKVFKGKLKVSDEIVFRQGSGADCIWTFSEKSIGRQYLFYLARPEKVADDPYMPPNKRGLWVGFTCGRSNVLSRATEDLLYLENMKKVRGKTRISGTLGRWRDVDLPVEGRRVRIIGPKKTYETKTDANGVFEIYDLPAGQYFVETHMPSGWKIDPMWVSYSPSVARNEVDPPEVRSGKRVAIILEPKKHASVDIDFAIDNFVRGRVLDPKGQPIDHVCVYLLRPEKDWGPSGCTNRQGRYEITSVPEGEYVLVANQDDKLSSRKPFRRVFYPNVSERERAAVLAIGPGDVVENIDLVIPALAETVIVKGVLLYSDGNPVVEKSVTFKLTDAADRLDDVSERTDGEGRFTLKILKGLTGELAGEEWLPKDRYKNCPKVDELIAKSGGNNVTVSTNVIKLTTEHNVYDVELTLPFPRCEKIKD
jgi:hypothetical protein